MADGVVPTPREGQLIRDVVSDHRAKTPYLKARRYTDDLILAAPAGGGDEGGGGGGGDGCSCDNCIAGGEIADGTYCCMGWLTIKTTVRPFGDVLLYYVGNDQWSSETFEHECAAGTQVYRWDLVLTGTDPGEVTLTLTEITDDGCNTMTVVYTNCCIWHCQCENVLTVKNFNFQSIYNSDDMDCEICLVEASTATEPDIGDFGEFCFTNVDEMPSAWYMDITDFVGIECDGDPDFFLWQYSGNPSCTEISNIFADVNRPVLLERTAADTWKADYSPLAYTLSGTITIPTFTWTLKLTCTATAADEYTINLTLDMFWVGIQLSGGACSAGTNATFVPTAGGVDYTQVAPADVPCTINQNHDFAWTTSSGNSGLASFPGGVEGDASGTLTVVPVGGGAEGCVNTGIETTPPTASGDCTSSDYGGGGGGTSACCPGVTLPATVYLSIGGFVTLPLTWDGTKYKIFTSFGVCTDKNFWFTLVCVNGVWNLEVTCDSGGTVISTTAATTTQCDPLLLTFSGVQWKSIACGCDEDRSDEITVTE